MDGKEMKNISFAISVLLTLCFVCSCAGAPAGKKGENV